MLPQVLFEEFFAQQDASPPFFGLEPCLDPGPRLRGLDELEPVPARRMAGLSYDLYLVAVAKDVLEGDDLAVHLGAHALVADIGMDAVGKIDGRRALWQFLDVAARREDVDHVREKVSLDRVHELFGVRQVALPLHELPEPGELLLLPQADRGALLVPPVRGDAFLGHAVHFVGADLEFDALPFGADDGRMERLIEIGFRNADKILESARYRRPERVDEPQDGVAVHLGISDDPDRNEVVDVLE